jgi:hypothetical protein
MRIALACALAWGALALPLGAQTPPAEQSEVLGVVARLFEGMRTADSTMARSTLADGARFALVDDQGRLAFEPMDGWLAALAGSQRRWEERIYDVEVRIDGRVASAWAPYTFYLDGRVLHCGIDSFELLRGADGWKITQVADTRRTDGCPDPPSGR